MVRRAVIVLGVMVMGLGCEDAEPGDTTLSDTHGADTRVEEDSAVLDAADTTRPETAEDTSTPPPTATDYCERTVDFFCAYYVRCGRVVASTEEACREHFLETCNADFEPQYIALEAEGLLSLSESGMAACEAHLETVVCSEQLFDLDGGCGAMWVGAQPVGGACAPGIESFVCAPGSACVLGLDFCGTCQEAAAVGASCAAQEVTCETSARCVDGSCVTRSLPGAACSDTQPCVVGAGCTEGTCVGFDVVAVGEACDRDRRCPYGAECVSGLCEVAPRLGEPCSSVPCATGTCEGGLCVENSEVNVPGGCFP